ncbi:M48 family metalloprotease [Sinirhodobacter sp. WL0062]|uniref:M48 family metalloprotease n=1 Tax=Rhodobacter flavimaris TaxID=2907145 RepID=A0ABS8YSV5_9RHOB|nr:M48 family metallopeptidase [Sinirhodobacter sp. WL0062]MCE5972548.1 M48 family metalloprotease [Sinirhodobacter sp. WL0062]
MGLGTRNLFRAIVLAFLVLGGVLIAANPPRYKVDLQTLSEIWADVFRDLDAAARSVRISTPMEVELGREISERFWDSPGSVEAQKYVESVGLRLSRHVQRQNIPWTFHVVNQRYANAWAILGGQVYITQGMLDLIGSEAELAAILGHEMAHVDLYHCVNRVQNRLVLEKLGLDAIGAVLGFAEDFVGVGYSEVQEREADRQGMLLAASAGYSPLKSFDTYYKFYLKYEADDEAQRPSGGPEGEVLKSLGGFLSDYFATHPPFVDRLEALRALLASNSPNWEGRRFYIGARSYQRMQAVTGIFPADEMWKFSTKSADYLALRSEVAFYVGRQGEAERFLKDLKSGYPDDPRLEHLDALVTGQLKPKPLAAPEAVPPTQLGSVPTKIDAQTRQFYEIAMSDFQAGAYPQAISGFKSALARVPEYDDALVGLSWLYTSAGVPGFRDQQQAKEIAEKAVAVAKTSEAYNALGAVSAHLGELAQAMASYRSAMSNPDYAQRLRSDLVYQGYLTARSNAGDLDRALEQALAHRHIPFILAQSVVRVEHLIGHKSGYQARQELIFLKAIYPEHRDVLRLTAYFEAPERLGLETLGADEILYCYDPKNDRAFIVKADVPSKRDCGLYGFRTSRQGYEAVIARQTAN